MSNVTNIILTFGICEDEVDEDKYILMETVNNWLAEQGHPPFGEDADICSGGSKHLECPLYIAAFKNFPTETFLGLVFGLPWDEPENVQVFIKDEEDERFTLISKNNPLVKEIN